MFSRFAWTEFDGHRDTIVVTSKVSVRERHITLFLVYAKQPISARRALINVIAVNDFGVCQVIILA